MVWRNKQFAQSGGSSFSSKAFSCSQVDHLQNASDLVPGRPFLQYQYAGAIKLLCVNFLLQNPQWQMLMSYSLCEGFVSLC